MRREALKEAYINIIEGIRNLDKWQKINIQWSRDIYCKFIHNLAIYVANW
jgi:hypothetical protein